MTAVTSLRHAGLGDLADVGALAQVIWRQYYPGILSPEQIEYMLARGYSREALAPFVTEPGRGLALAERGGGAVGFAAWYPPGEPGTTKLDKLYVHPAHHGEGIGAMLLDHVAGVARASSARTLVLNVNRGNIAAIRWYERMGFVVRERGDFPIGNGFTMHDYIMERPL